MAKEFKITSLRLADLEKELNYLKTTREREVAAMIAEARSYGDLSENSEYDAAKNEQAKLYGRIAEIEDVLSHAVIIEDENEATGRVGLGCTVVVEDENGKQTEYRITGSQEANPMEFKLSDDSPFGRAVVGKAAADGTEDKPEKIAKEEWNVQKYGDVKRALFALKKMKKALTPESTYKRDVQALYASGLGNPGGMITALNLKQKGGR